MFDRGLSRMLNLRMAIGVSVMSSESTESVRGSGDVLALVGRDEEGVFEVGGDSPRACTS